MCLHSQICLADHKWVYIVKLCSVIQRCTAARPATEIRNLHFCQVQSATAASWILRNALLVCPWEPLDLWDGYVLMSSGSPQKASRPLCTSVAVWTPRRTGPVNQSPEILQSSAAGGRAIWYLSSSWHRVWSPGVLRALYAQGLTAPAAPDTRVPRALRPATGTRC